MQQIIMLKKSRSLIIDLLKGDKMMKIVFILALLFVALYAQSINEVEVIRDGEEFQDRLEPIFTKYYEVFVNEYEDDDALQKDLTVTFFPCAGTIEWWIGDVNVDRPTKEEAIYISTSDEESRNSDVATFVIEDVRVGHYQIGVEPQFGSLRNDFIGIASTDELPYPELPSDAFITFVPQNRSAVRVSWNESPSIGIDYCVYFHHETQRDPENIVGSFCHAERQALVGCTTDTSLDVDGVTKDGIYYFDVVAINDKNFKSAYITSQYFTGDTYEAPSSSDSSTFLPSLFLIFVAFVFFM
eukprot:TRINITY_DN415_c0_g1_i1.p1 TRINITY_DN415_c0_g1~~TRINITY_DN415_c0_g1_i1.p1  ORF type:complete len:299 (-),score=106.76 TRINITY_DN415_c0_g1_i1:77-973(-)